MTAPLPPLAPAPDYAVVIPTIGRDSLDALLADLAAQHDPRPREVVVVDDRRVRAQPLDVPEALPAGVRVRVVPGFGRGPAAARNLGWRLCTAEWIAFLDDDVRLPAGWSAALAADLCLPDDVAGSQARLDVPLPADRAPTDWERNVAGLTCARWATADMAFRRAALDDVVGFDTRFPRAYREDADLALRLRRRGWRLVTGRRTTIHPIRPAPAWISVRLQRGNADDALMRRLHGRRWRIEAQSGPGRLRAHLLTVLAGSTAMVAAVTGRTLRGHSESGARGHAAALIDRLARIAACVWATLTTEFAWRRIAPGPRTLAEVRLMVLTSVVVPFAAVLHRARGWWRHRHARPWPPPPRAVLFDRDGTLVHDVPYNGDPSAVQPVADAGEALRRIRAEGLPTGVVSNQSGIARGLLSWEQVSRVCAEIDRQLGPFTIWKVCPHRDEDRCACRKPAPGLILSAARSIRVHPAEVVLIGDIGADVEAARAAGARSVLVPTERTRPGEVADAPFVACDLKAAVDLALGGRHA